nr:hypothetical protein [Tanacetum cinerariifolium]
MKDMEFENEDNMQNEYAEPVVSNTVDKSNANFNENVIDDTEIVDNVMNKTKGPFGLLLGITMGIGFGMG